MSAGRIFVGITGASGVVYGVRLVQALAELGREVDLAVSDAGIRVLAIETGIRVDAGRRDASGLVPPALLPRVRLHDNHSIEAGPASGSYRVEAAAICPCSMGTLGRIASGYSSCLIERAADVALKESRRLVLVPRETPLSRIHLDHLARLAWAGATILPAMPAFYHRPRSVEDLVDHLVGKVLDALGVEHSLARRWATPKTAGDPGPRPDLEASEDDLGEGCDR
jgi:flavin prenyltransferase